MAKKFFLLCLFLFIISSCASIQDTRYAHGVLYPDLDYMINKRKNIIDSQGNKLELVLLGMRLNQNSVSLFILWKMDAQISEKYQISFSNYGDAAFYIQSNKKRVKLLHIEQGPIAPSVLETSSQEGGIVELRFPSFDPEKFKRFDLIEGDYISVQSKSALTTTIHRATRWNFRNCILKKMR